MLQIDSSRLNVVSYFVCKLPSLFCKLIILYRLKAIKNIVTEFNYIFYSMRKSKLFFIFLYTWLQ